MNGEAKTAGDAPVPRRRALAGRLQSGLRSVLQRWRGPLILGFRVWVAATVALYIAFALQLDAPYWAATSAVLASQPQVGASIRRGWFRVIGTLVGAVASYALGSAFPQDRIPLLVCLSLWTGIAAFASTLLRNFAQYAGALSGYTVAIILGTSLGDFGNVSPAALFTLDTARSSEIVLGIVCAGVLRSLTDRGDAGERLSAALTSVMAETAGHVARLFEMASSRPTPTDPALRRDLLRRISALDPVIDQTMGETGRLRYYSSVLNRAVAGSFSMLAAWYAAETYLATLPPGQARGDAERGLAALPRWNQDLFDPAAMRTEPLRLRRQCRDDVQFLTAFTATTASQRLMADKAAEFLSGMDHALGGLALLHDLGRSEAWDGRRVRRVATMLPALVNAGRAFAVVSCASLLWVVTGWPNGMEAVTFAALTTLLIGTRGPQMRTGSVMMTCGIMLCAAAGITLTFAAIPRLTYSFTALALAIGVYLIPMAAAAQALRNKSLAAVCSTGSTMFFPLMAPTNVPSFDGAATFNADLAICSGCLFAIIAFRLMGALPPQLVARRLVWLAQLDMRRLVGGDTVHNLTGRMFSRLEAMPAEATPYQRAQLMVALSVGNELQFLNTLAASWVLPPGLRPVLDGLNSGRVAEAADGLDRIAAGMGVASQTALRARAAMLVIAVALRQHPDFFAVEGHP